MANWEPLWEPTWEQVLASFEATAEQAEALLAGPGGSADNAVAEPLPAPAVPAVGYDVWQLTMPELPITLRDRALEVHHRQLRLAKALQSSMDDIRCQQQPALQRQEQLAADAGGPTTRPMFVDHVV